MKRFLILMLFCTLTASSQDYGRVEKPFSRENVYKMAWVQGFRAAYELLKDRGYAPYMMDSVIHNLYRNRFLVDSIWFHDYYRNSK